MSCNGNHPSISSEDAAEVVLQGVSICPGTGIGRLHIVDPELAVQPVDLDPSRVEAETKRYAAAVRKTKSRLREHIATVHGDSTPETKSILDIHKAMRDPYFQSQ